MKFPERKKEEPLESQVKGLSKEKGFENMEQTKQDRTISEKEMKTEKVHRE